MLSTISAIALALSISTLPASFLHRPADAPTDLRDSSVSRICVSASIDTDYTAAKLDLSCGNMYLETNSDKTHLALTLNKSAEAYGIVFESHPFVLERDARSISFDLSYDFLVRALGSPPEGMSQGLMIFDFEIQDKKTGSIHPRQSALLKRHSLTVPPGESTRESFSGNVGIALDRSWTSSRQGKEVVVRVIANLHPGELHSMAKHRDCSSSETHSDFD